MYAGPFFLSRYKYKTAQMDHQLRHLKGSQKKRSRDLLAADEITNSHKDYKQYPCFFVHDDDGARSSTGDVLCIGSLSQFEQYCNRNGMQNRRFTLFCLDKCRPCEAAKRFVHANQEDLDIRILLNRDGDLTWVDMAGFFRNKPTTDRGWRRF